MRKHTLPHALRRVSRALSLGALGFVAGTLSFFLGLQSVGDMDPIGTTGAQQAQTTSVNILLQYKPVGSETPVPIVVTPAMNPSQTALLNLQEIHTGGIFPSNPADRCRSTSTVGRCNVANVPVGGTPETQYDIFVDTTFLEFLTRIPFESEGAFVRFDRSVCNQTSFTEGKWCLGKQGNAYAAEYAVTITLRERNTCRDTVPPAPLCDTDPRRIVNFACNPSTSAPTRPWEPKPTPCGVVQCPDGNRVDGRCGKIGTSFAFCSTAFSCTGNQLCEVQNFGTRISYAAGKDTIIIRGKRFGALGGTVSFPVEGGSRETVQVARGPDWTETEIRVAVPQQAIAGTLEIHPNTHGFFGEGSTLKPAVCVSPPASILAFRDQFSLLTVNATTPGGVQLVSPGFSTTFILLVRHNDKVGRFAGIDVELLQGAFPDPQNLPLRRTVITQAKCPIEIVGSASAKEATLKCVVPVPESAGAFQGPFTFLVTLADDRGGTARAVLLDSGTSAMIGDFNLDGRLTVEDAAVGFRLARGTAAVQPAHLQRDTNKDGKITAEDALFVLHSLVP